MARTYPQFGRSDLAAEKQKGQLTVKSGLLTTKHNYWLAYSKIKIQNNLLACRYDVHTVQGKASPDVERWVGILQIPYSSHSMGREYTERSSCIGRRTCLSGSIQQRIV
jgi:hypothetical protein